MTAYAVRYTTSENVYATAIVDNADSELLAAIRATRGRYIIGDVEVWALPDAPVRIARVWEWDE